MDSHLERVFDAVGGSDVMNFEGKVGGAHHYTLLC